MSPKGDELPLSYKFSRFSLRFFFLHMIFNKFHELFICLVCFFHRRYTSLPPLGSLKIYEQTLQFGFKANAICSCSLITYFEQKKIENEGKSSATSIESFISCHKHFNNTMWGVTCWLLIQTIHIYDSDGMSHLVRWCCEQRTMRTFYNGRKFKKDIKKLPFKEEKQAASEVN